MRKVFLDDLPRRGKMISWVDSVGYVVSFIYDDIEGDIKITSYSKTNTKLSVIYNNQNFNIHTVSLSECRIGRILKKDINNTEKQFNISITHPHLLKYFVNKNDAYNNTYGSNKKVLFKCLDCGSEKNLSINYVTRYDTISCGCSSDGISYPEKFIFNLLLQLNIEFKKQLNKRDVEWINSGIRYDFAILNSSTIIETHGIQHYEDKFSKLTNLSIEEQNIIDNNKELLARSNGIEHYIILDCRKSELEWIKKSVMESELPSLLNFKEDDVNWLKCHESALKNLIKDVCDYKLKYRNLSCSQIGKIFNLHKSTIGNYLKAGSKLGWCKYDIDIERKNQLHRLQEINKKRCNKKIEIFKDEESVGTFNSIIDLVNKSMDIYGVKLIASSISRVCNGKLNTHHGFTFKFI